MTDLVLPAPAKINLHLQVDGKRPDGYHLLDTSFAYVDIADRLEFNIDQKLSVSCSRSHLSGPGNLVYVVLDALRKTYGIRQGMHVVISKHLPEKAGLGGGSSDAATAIMAANDLWKLSLSTKELIDFSIPFGADIPCFLFGRASIASGTGERLLPLSHSLPKGYVLLAYPGKGVSTMDVFRHHDTLIELTQNKQLDMIRNHSNSNVCVDRLGCNDLEVAATSICPAIGHLLCVMRVSEGTSWMSGSGSTCVGLFPSRSKASSLAEDLKSKGLASWTHIGSLLDLHPMKAA
ncbi:MAG: 4-(cytidine 5'-diphospho)-2-C-methyl-D-erythritol kinase [Mariprofundaceae bacterium]